MLSVWIPEGLVLLTSVSFILGVGRLARKQALVQEMEAIEALARVNVLCLDKTGTITTGDLEVVEVVPCGTMSDEKIREVMNEITFAFNDVNPTQQALMNYFEKDAEMADNGSDSVFLCEKISCHCLWRARSLCAGCAGIHYEE